MVSGIADNMQTSLLSVSANKNEKPNIYEMIKNVSAGNAKEFYSPEIPPTGGRSMLINSLEGFISACTEQTNNEAQKRGLKSWELGVDPDFDYEAEFKKYMESRGCENEKELQALNTTCCETKEQLVQRTAMLVTNGIANLHINGFANSMVMPHDMTKLCSNMSIEDLVSYGNSVEDTGSPFADQANELNAFLSKLLGNNACNDELSQKFSEIIKSTTDLKDEILAFSNKLEEQNLMFRAENERSRVFGEDNNQNSAYQNYPEYKASLVAQYQK